ncbi:septum formation initiator family protein [Actinomadura sp. HBU206391]|nr:septum formation initiator family protein [Actinomadura sp. HBU206391]
MPGSVEGKVSRPADERPAGAAARSHLTSRAAILAIVMCAIALSLAYPVREYVAQRREIAELRHQERVAQQQVEELALRKQRLGDESYIKREARRRLHYCMPGEKCYVVLDGNGATGKQDPQAASGRTPPWYATLWRSVEAADRR